LLRLDRRAVTSASAGSRAIELLKHAWARGDVRRHAQEPRRRMASSSARRQHRLHRRRQVKWTEPTASRDSGAAVTPDTLFQAASMSKALAAPGRCGLAEQAASTSTGTHSHLSRWKVPAAPSHAEKKVTLRALLSHTAGLTVSGFPGYRPASRSAHGADPERRAAVQHAGRPLVRGPGTYAYSGGGYTVAQLAIAEPAAPTGAGRDWCCARRACASPPAPAPAEGAAAQGRQRHTLRRSATRAKQHLSGVRAAGLWTTPSDYGRFFDRLQDAYPDAAAACCAGQRPGHDDARSTRGYGLGSHSGAGAATRSSSTAAATPASSACPSRSWMDRGRASSS
jgi:CubicO group peptidase (beta-lactamase class C family)